MLILDLSDFFLLNQRLETSKHGINCNDALPGIRAGKCTIYIEIYNVYTEQNTFVWHLRDIHLLFSFHLHYVNIL